MTIFEAVLLGIVQGLTEFLPVSSSGHLVLTQHLLGWQQPDLIFDVWLHFSTLLAVVLFFWKDLLQLRKKEWLIILVGSIPVALIGILFSDIIEIWFGSIQVVGVALLVTGLFNIKTGKILRKQQEIKNKSDVNFKQGFIIGLFQALAIIPGISRSGSTVFVGIMQGLDRIKVFKFSFFLSLPAILGASLLQLVKVSRYGFDQTISFSYLLAALAAFMTGLIGLHVFEYIIKKARLDWFGWYCVVMSLGYFVFF